MTQAVVALLERHGFTDIEHMIVFLAEAYLLARGDSSSDQALADLDAELKALIGTRFGLVVDIAWRFLSPALRPIIQHALDSARAAVADGKAA